LSAFQVGPQDAKTLAEQFAGDIIPQDLIALPKYTAYARLLIDWMSSRPFSMMTPAPRKPTVDYSRVEIVRRTSRHRYVRRADQVEREMENAIACARRPFFVRWREARSYWSCRSASSPSSVVNSTYCKLQRSRVQHRLHGCKPLLLNSFR
jgi:hypothetical protein